MGASIVRKSLREAPDAQNARVPNLPIRTLKLQQCAKIAEFGRALQAAGLHSTASQAKALGLSRSTTWSLLRAGHKSTGLTGSIVRRILSSPELPSEARRVVEQYVTLKLAGAYGHDKIQIRRFQKALADYYGEAAKRKLAIIVSCGGYAP